MLRWPDGQQVHAEPSALGDLGVGARRAVDRDEERRRRREQRAHRCGGHPAGAAGSVKYVTMATVVACLPECLSEQLDLADQSTPVGVEASSCPREIAQLSLDVVAEPFVMERGSVRCDAAPTISRGSRRDGRTILARRRGGRRRHDASRVRRADAGHRRAVRRGASTSSTSRYEADRAVHSAMWLPPRSPRTSTRRRLVHRHWAEGSFGLMGRTPDHVASMITAFAAPPRRVRSRRDPLRRQRDGVLPAGPRQRLVRLVRGHAAPGRSIEAGPSAAGAVPLPRRRRGARRRHRRPRRADDRHLGGHLRLPPAELHRPAPAG